MVGVDSRRSRAPSWTEGRGRFSRFDINPARRYRGRGSIRASLSPADSCYRAGVSGCIRPRYRYRGFCFLPRTGRLSSISVLSFESGVFTSYVLAHRPAGHLFPGRRGIVYTPLVRNDGETPSGNTGLRTHEFRGTLQAATWLPSGIRDWNPRDYSMRRVESIIGSAVVVSSVRRAKR